MKVREMTIAVVDLETIPKSLDKRLVELEIRRRIETIQTTVLLRTLGREMETWENLQSSRLLWKTSSER